MQMRQLARSPALLVVRGNARDNLRLLDIEPPHRVLHVVIVPSLHSLEEVEELSVAPAEHVPQPRVELMLRREEVSRGKERLGRHLPREFWPYHPLTMRKRRPRIFPL